MRFLGYLRANLVNDYVTMKLMGVKYFEPSFMRLQHLFDTRAVDDDDNLTKIGRMMSLEVQHKLTEMSPL